jgi:hypothetical protein
LVEKRNCWIDEGGDVSSSIHNQWNPLINDIFDISNKQDLDKKTRKERIRELLQEEQEATRINLMREAVNDKLFMADMAETMSDFEHPDFEK